MVAKNEELLKLMTKFADSGWDLICEPAEAWIMGTMGNKEMLQVLEQANNECGNCGCEFDPLYGRAIELLGA